LLNNNLIESPLV